MCPCNDPPRNRKVPPLLRFLRVVGAAALLLALFRAHPVVAQPRQARIHPAVVRVIAQDESGRSLGSGALVAVNESFGLVLTNWHVIRDTATPPTVVFPDGFQSAATIARMDRDWDLAALVIWRPRADPIPLATTFPRPGDQLAIAGYGKGQYGVDTGRCTQYLSPGKHHPYELVELSASARQGDSGGPIFNDRGELAGVLFGSAFGRTTGSHSGRVRQFLAPLWDDFHQQRPDSNTMIAARPQPNVPTQPNRPVASIHGVRTDQGVRPAPGASGAGTPPNAVAVSAVRGSSANTAPAVPSFGHNAVSPSPDQQGGPPGIAAVAGSGYPPPEGGGEAWVASTHVAPPEVSPPYHPPSRSEQLKTILAAIGILALVFHGVRLLGRAVEV